MLSCQQYRVSHGFNMDRETELDIIRRAYAKHITAAAAVTDRRVENAFAAVRREAFLGPGPRPILRWGRGYEPTPSRDPVYLYDYVLVGIVPERNLNNGEPSFLAFLIASAAPKAGEHSVHIGAGVGYYTAILQRLATRTGKVTAIEFDPALAARLAANFANARNVKTVCGDGTTVEFDPADVILVNAGATRPADLWLDRLRDGGRLILPLTTAGFPDENVRHGAVFRIERHGDDFPARRISSVGIFPCEGARDPESEAALASAFASGGVDKVTRL
ncbi:MAG TPA: rRNA adenine N-6-methyltransferase family protein, partial [Pirellulales bacterium]|nr:rRNA adenine N-6-methyltransferase family protein [Pirellulales bacterium]